MTVEAQKKALTKRFAEITARVVNGDPNDFDTQLPLTLESFDPETRSMLVSFQLERRFGNPYGIAHGGIVATLLDIAQGAAVAVYTKGNHRISTISLQVSYLKPVHTGQTVYVRTKLIDTSATTAFCTAEVWQEPGCITNSSVSVYHLGKDKE